MGVFCCCCCCSYEKGNIDNLPITKNGCKQKPSFVLEVAVHVLRLVLLKRQKKGFKYLIIKIYILKFLFLYFLFVVIVTKLTLHCPSSYCMVLVQVQTFKIFANNLQHTSTTSSTSTRSISYT